MDFIMTHVSDILLGVIAACLVLIIIQLRTLRGNLAGHFYNLEQHISQWLGGMVNRHFRVWVDQEHRPAIKVSGSVRVSNLPD